MLAFVAGTLHDARMEKRTERLYIRLTKDELEHAQKLAENAGLTVSELVRDHLGKTTVRNRNDERQRTINLNRINANLNMIARWVNTHKSNADTTQVLVELIAIDRLIKEYNK